MVVVRKMMSALLSVTQPKVLFVAVLVAGAYMVHATTPSGTTNPATSPVAKSASSKPGKATAKNDWKSLSPVQRTALAPLEKDWNRLDDFRKEKWIELANRFTTMTPTEQSRMQERMRDWVALSPEERRLARENYKRVQKAKVEKGQQWEQYQQLPEEKKKELAATAVPKKPLANPPRTVQKPVTPVHPPVGASPANPLPASSAAMHEQNGKDLSQSGSIPVQSSPSTP
ncbi:MAG: DUF3106 domain-containing protein [Oxalicibacterium faecigallinarum]|uniref:DUF3106 domain-containing protein n=1 Tax=Oxalicibacterium faecigallinarum TaxID=573741 RepID=UPI002809A706|nr:DUF3106 domain-containing protein [Oxalicibacterium faecigallinarum]MDQ7968485.1 DUF3106 domain-containing protein [Oxalicibacterium faecigallinarum]